MEQTTHLLLVSEAVFEVTRVTSFSYNFFLFSNVFCRALQTKRTKKQEAKPNKGLRHFSVKVSQTVTYATPSYKSTILFMAFHVIARLLCHVLF